MPEASRQRATPRMRPRRRHLRERPPSPVHARHPTPIYISPRTQLILILAGIALTIVIAYAAPSAVQLLLISATLALVLSFPVRSLSRVMRRGWAIALVMLGVVLLALVILLVVVPYAIIELTRLAVAAPNVVDEVDVLAEEVLDELWRRGLLPLTPDEVLDRFRAGLFDRLEIIVQTLLQAVVNVLAGTLTVLISAFGVLFLTTYFLADVRRFKAFYAFRVPHRYRADALALWDTLADSLSRYLAGLFLSISIQGVAVTLALFIIGVPYAVPLGLWMAVTALIPYLGAFLAAIPAVLIALTISFPMALLTGAVYIVINLVEGNLLTPRIQGSAVRVHPVLIFLAVIAGGQLAGILGVVLAVPALAVLRVLADFFAARLRVRPGQSAMVRAPSDGLPKS